MTDIHDQHDNEVRKIITDLKRLAVQDTAVYYSGDKKGLTAIAASIREISPTFFRDMLDAMRQIERNNPIKPGSYEPGRLE